MLHKILLVGLTELNGINAAGNEAVRLRTTKQNLRLAANYRESVSPAPMVNVPIEFLNSVNDATFKRCQNLEQLDLKDKLIRTACNILISRLGRLLRLASRGEKYQCVWVNKSTMKHRA